MLASSNHHYTPMEIVPMEPLFDEDWLHEHNLDILFDLFEEEVERKGLDNATTTAATNNSSSTIFGSSPVTSYLFGTSPPFASALDIYDLLYFDNNQQPINNAHHHQSQNAASNTSTTTSSSTTTSTSSTKTTTPTKDPSTKDHLANSQNKSNIQDAPKNNNNNTKTYNVNGLANSTSISNLKQRQHHNQTAAGQNVTNSYLANSITNAMRIKRRFKKGQNEGISLLAKPLSNNSGNGSSSSSCCSGSSTSNSNSSMTMTNNQNNSDKSSTKITTTNLKKPNCNESTRGIDIKQSHHNRNRHLQNHNHHNVHHITGFSIIREHAYAVRGH